MVEREHIRESNFELLRIIAMVMIVVLHYMGKGGALNNTKPNELNFIIAHFSEALSIVAVNCYMMITGYFLVNSNFNLRKLITLWIQVLFYSIGIYFVLLVIGIEKFSVKTFVKVSFPVFLKDYWFISGYIALFLFSPFLNNAIKAFGRGQLERLLLLILILTTVWNPVMPYIDFLEVVNGYSLTQFIIMYILGAYIRLHWDFRINKYIYLLGYFIAAALIGLVSIPLYTTGNSSQWNSILEYSFSGVIIEAFCLFMFIRELNIKSIILNKIAPLTLGVYLIHEHFLLRPLIYSKILNTSGYYHSKLFGIHSLVSCLSIFLICILIDFFRKALFNFIISKMGKCGTPEVNPLKNTI